MFAHGGHNSYTSWSLLSPATKEEESPAYCLLNPKQTPPLLGLYAQTHISDSCLQPKPHFRAADFFILAPDGHFHRLFPDYENGLTIPTPPPLHLAPSSQLGDEFATVGPITIRNVPTVSQQLPCPSPQSSPQERSPRLAVTSIPTHTFHRDLYG